MKNELQEAWDEYKKKQPITTGSIRDRFNFQHGFNAAFKLFGKVNKSNCSGCDFVEIWPSYDEQRCKHHKLKSGDRKILGKKIPQWCPLKNDQTQQK